MRYFILLIFVIGVTNLSAQPKSIKLQVYDSVTDEFVETALTDLGMTFNIKKQNAYQVNYEHKKATLIIQDKQVHIYTAFLKKSSSVDIYKVNKLNASFGIATYCTAYIDEDGDAILKATFSFNGGATNISFYKFFNNFGNSIRQFESILAE